MIQQIQKYALQDIPEHVADNLDRTLPESVCTMGDGVMYIDLGSYVDSDVESDLLDEIIDSIEGMTPDVNLLVLVF